MGGRSAERSVLYLIGLAVAAAGCFGGGEGDASGDEEHADAPPSSPFVNPLVGDHDHEDPALHALSWNMVRTGGSLLEQGLRGYGQPHALDIKRDLLFVSAYAATGDPVAGLAIFDLSVDAYDPPQIGEWSIPGPAAGDRNMEATADGTYVVLSIQSQDCFGNLGPIRPGLYLIDTNDPRQPTEVHYLPIEGTNLGLHSITIYSTEEGDFVYHGGGPERFYRIDRETQQLVEAGTMDNGHDSSVYLNATHGTPLLLSADVSHLSIYDLSDPTRPEVLGVWNVPDPDLYYVHTVVADRIEGRDIAIVNSEDFRHAPTAFWVLDITDPSDPLVLSEWKAPDDVPSGDLVFSLHNPRIADGILTFSFYHGGVWQFDLRDPASWEAPVPRAYFLPHEPIGRTAPPDGAAIMSPYCGILVGGTDDRLDVLAGAVPFTVDVELYGDYVYAADLNTGVQVLRYEPGS